MVFDRYLTTISSCLARYTVLSLQNSLARFEARTQHRQTSSHKQRNKNKYIAYKNEIIHIFNNLYSNLVILSKVDYRIRERSILCIIMTHTQNLLLQEIQVFVIIVLTSYRIK